MTCFYNWNNDDIYGVALDHTLDASPSLIESRSQFKLWKYMLLLKVIRIFGSNLKIHSSFTNIINENTHYCLYHHIAHKLLQFLKVINLL